MLATYTFPIELANFNFDQTNFELINLFPLQLDKVEEELSLGRLSRNETWHRTPVSRTCLNVPQSMVSQFVLVPELWMVVVLTTAAILSCVAVCIVIYLAVSELIHFIA